MKTLIIYSSKTGNTKKVAEGILEVMPKNTVIAPIEDNIDSEEFDLVLIGYWVDKTTADSKILSYIEKISGKKIGIFATLGAYPDSKHASDALKNIRELLEPRNEVIAEFICQGKVDPKITEQFEKLPLDHPMSMTPKRRQRHKDASTHPNQDDIKNSQDVFRDIV